MAPYNNYIIVILDSCRFDSFQRAGPKAMARPGKVEQRWSYASWTAPSHFNLLMGLLPHTNPRESTRRNTTNAIFSKCGRWGYVAVQKIV